MDLQNEGWICFLEFKGIARKEAGLRESLEIKSREIINVGEETDLDSNPNSIPS